jgi:hypothetical protein
MTGRMPNRSSPTGAVRSWYGTTSGTYWTLNPKEYADPRKHGPEYQARRAGVLRGARRRPAPTGAGPDRVRGDR